LTNEADLEQVVRWAEAIRAAGAANETEAAELRKLGPRGSRNAGGAAATRQKQQRQEKQRELGQRRLRHGLGQALLSGVLLGDITLDVQPGGELLFRHKQAQPSPAACVSAEQNGTQPPPVALQTAAAPVRAEPKGTGVERPAVLPPAESALLHPPGGNSGHPSFLRLCLEGGFSETGSSLKWERGVELSLTTPARMPLS
jgi:hypothetical protein